MSDYTPTTEDIRNAYMSGDWNDNPTDDDAMKRHFAAKFDRWLTAHDAEVRADEREKVAQRIAAVSLAPEWLLAAIRGGEQA